MTPAQIKAAVIVTAEGCWQWQHRVDDDGYGRSAFRRSTWLAHRMAWTVFNGEIPSGMVLNHCCRNRRCVNPLHLMVLTRLENTMIGLSPPACNARKVSCEHGHAFDEQNTYRHKGRRSCRACNAIAAAKYKARSRSKRGSCQHSAHPALFTGAA